MANYLINGFWPVLPVAVLVFLVELVFGSEGGDKSSRPVSGGILTLGIGLLVNVIVMWLTMPTFTHFFDPAAGWFGLLIVDTIIAVAVTGILCLGRDSVQSPMVLLVMAVIGFVSYIIAGNLFVTPAMSLVAFCDNAGNKSMTKLLRVEDVSAASIIEDNDIDNLIKVSPADAMTKARNALGGPDALGSYLQVDREYLKRVGPDRHPYWIVSLQVTSWQAFSNRGGFIPGYVLVDALDKDRPAELKTGFKMKYVPGAQLADDLERFVYEHYTLGRGVTIMDLDGLEVDDSFKPYYTGTVVKPAIGFKGKAVVGVIVLDPQTGQIDEYDIGKEPPWVKRIYPTALLEEQADWWGTYISHDDCPWQGNAGIRKVDHVTDVTTRSGGQEVQISFTSPNPQDTALTDLIVVDAKTGKARRATDIFGSTPEKVEQVMSLASKQINNIEHDAVAIQLEHVLNRDVWFAILQTKPTKSDKGTTLGVSVDGYAFLRRDLAAETSNVVIGRTVREAYDLLRAQIADQARKDPVIAQQQKKIQITGYVGRKNPLVLAGKTYFVFNLTGDQVPPKARFRVSADIYEAAQMQTGDLVTVTVYETKVEDYFDVLAILNFTFQSFGK